MLPLLSTKRNLLSVLLLLIFLNKSDGQRLSQGASDWYMRFHSNFRHVKRDVDPPEIKSFVVSSTIKVGYIGHASIKFAYQQNVYMPA